MEYSINFPESTTSLIPVPEAVPKANVIQDRCQNEESDIFSSPLN